MVYNPTVISQCLSTQANYINRVYGQMFYYTDRRQIWYDTQDGGRVQAYDIVILQYERDRNNFVPNNVLDFPTEPGYGIMATNDIVDYSIVYVVETNCLYIYRYNTWAILYGKYGSTLVAQTYYPDGTLTDVVADDVSTNGILNDGSVVVRDNNKMICGMLRSSGYVLDINSLIGGCLNLNPSGKSVGAGTLQLNSVFADSKIENSVANLNGDLVVFGDVKTVPASDWNKQYRLVTENINITQNSLIKSGSLIKAGSTLGETKYTLDTILQEDIQTSNGLIVQSSKLYINSIINTNILQPPFMFDIDIQQDVNNLSINKSINSDKIIIKDNVLIIDEVSNLKNSGDCCYIPVMSDAIKSVKKVKFNNKEYNVDFTAETGIENTATIKYYLITDSVKILP